MSEHADAQTMPGLDQLRDIVVPEQIALWPPGLAWWIALALWAALLVVIIRLLLRHHQHQAYRRQALQELQELQTQQDWARLPVLLKRTALVFAPRQDCAALTGTAWTQWLNRHGGRFTAELGQELYALTYQPGQAASPALLQACQHWLRHHKPAGQD